MKNYKKKIRNTILYTALGRGLIIGGIIALIIIIGEAALRIPGTGFLMAARSAVLTCLVCAGISLLFSTSKVKAFTKRTDRLQNYANSIDYDDMESLGPDIAMGNDWLVLRDKSKYSFWVRQRLDDLHLEDSQNPKAKKAILVVQDSYGIPEKYIVTKSARLEEKINEWMEEPEDEEENLKDWTEGPSPEETQVI